MAPRRLNGSVLAVITLVSLLTSVLAWAAPVSKSQAEQAALGWMRLNPGAGSKVAPMGAATIAGVREYHSAQGQLLAYVVELQPSGYIVVAADDNSEPIICYNSTQTFNSERRTENVLLSLLDRDIAARIARFAGPQPMSAQKTVILGQWRRYQQVAAGSVLPAATPIDVRVWPMVTSQWDQIAPYSSRLPNPADLTGCVATAMAQLAAYFRAPRHFMASTHNISVDGVFQLVNVDPTFTFDYDKMPNTLTGATAEQIQQVAELMRDCGVSLDSIYTTTGTSAPPAAVAGVFTGAMYYKTASWYSYDPATWKALLENELRAGRPVHLSIYSASVGHSIVADGYGFDSSLNEFFHLNLGWGGTSDEWYSLPVFSTGSGSTLINWLGINGFTYNIVPNVGPWVISGYVREPNNAPIAGVTMGGLPGSVVTDASGFYYGLVPDGWNGTVTPSKVGYVFQPASRTYTHVIYDQDEGQDYVSVPDEVKIVTAPYGVPNPVASSGTVNCAALATDTWSHPLTYLWTAVDEGGNPAGSFSDATASNPVWTAPANTTDHVLNYTITFAATCSGGKSAGASYIQKVLPVPEFLTITDGPEGTPDPVDSGGTVQCDVTVESNWGHTPTYMWKAIGPGGAAVGSFDDPTKRNPIWTAPLNHSDELMDVTMYVTARSGRAKAVTGSYTQQVNPVADAIVITSGPLGLTNPMPSGGIVHCRVFAEDSRNHPLSYQWSAKDGADNPAGSFNDPTVRNPVWTAPANLTDSPVNYTLTVRISCSGVVPTAVGEEITASYTQTVSPIKDVVRITSGPSGSGSPIDSLATVGVTVTAEDNRPGHALSYHWTAKDWAGNPAGSFDNADSREPEWTAPANMSDAIAKYTLTVTVTCDHGASASASFRQAVNPVPDGVKIKVGPSGTPNPVASSGVMACTVTAVDARRHDLTYAWTAQDGMGNPAGSFDNPNSRTPHWTAPANLTDAEAQYTISVVVTCEGAFTSSGAFKARVAPVPDQVTISSGPNGLPNPADSSATVNCAATATDSRGHGVSYLWTCSAGSFDDATKQNPVWIAPNNASESVVYHTITVTATCAQGASNSASYQQGVNPVPDVVTILSGPSPDVNPVESHGAVQCSITAQDSRGSALHYKWMATDAASRLAGTWSDDTAQNPTWFAPVNDTGTTRSYTILCVVTCSQGTYTSGYFVENVLSTWDAAAPARTLTLSGLNAQQVGGGVSLTYALSAPAQVEALVHNMAGIVIARIPLVAQAAGVQSLRWNGRNQAGSAVPSGLYLVTVRAVRPDGTAASELTALSLRR